MFGDLVLIHRPGGQSTTTLGEDLSRAGGVLSSIRNAFVWQTCLRQIAITEEANLETVRGVLIRGDEIHHGDAAYRFLLQVACGLHSPLIGETEVYGQVKLAVQQFAFPLTPWGSSLKRFFQMTFEDAKRVRQACLEDLGSQSYGSVLRRELKNARRIHVIGAGQLVQEILPWIAKDGNEIHIHARDAAKAAQALTGAKVSIHALSESGGSSSTLDVGPIDALIIAAPLDRQALERWLGEREVKIVADLRADSAEDAINVPGAQVLSLADFFSRISENRVVIDERKRAAIALIEAAVVDRSFHVEYRPFGWEDVCA